MRHLDVRCACSLGFAPGSGPIRLSSARKTLTREQDSHPQVLRWHELWDYEGSHARRIARGYAVDITVTIAEGEPIRVSGVDFVGFELIPRAHLDEMRKRVPLRIGEPRDRQLVLATHAFQYLMRSPAASDSAVT